MIITTYMPLSAWALFFAYTRCRGLGWRISFLVASVIWGCAVTLLHFVGTVLFFISILLGVGQIASRLLFPGLAPRGVTTLLLSTLFFGSINLFALGIIGEYIAKIFEEVKQRPLFIRK